MSCVTSHYRPIDMMVKQCIKDTDPWITWHMVMLLLVIITHCILFGQIHCLLDNYNYKYNFDTDVTYNFKVPPGKLHLQTLYLWYNYKYDMPTIWRATHVHDLPVTMRAWPVARSIFDLCERSERADLPDVAWPAARSAALWAFCPDKSGQQVG